MNRVQMRDHLLYGLGREVPASANAFEQAAVARAVAAALQMLWLAGASYFLRQPIDIVLVAGQSSYALGATTQEAYGPARLTDGRTLRRFENLSALHDFGLEVLGQPSRAVANGVPWGYLVEHGRNTGSGDDPHRMAVRLVPAPDAAAVAAYSPLTLEGVVECPSYTYGDLATGAFPVPEGYVETYLLPLARRELTRDPLFSRRELVARYEADAQMAMQALGLADEAAEATGDTGAETNAGRTGKRRQPGMPSTNQPPANSPA